MKIIYLVVEAEGSCSSDIDFCNLAAFTSKEKAQAYLEYLESKQAENIGRHPYAREIEYLLEEVDFHDDGEEALHFSEK